MISWKHSFKRLNEEYEIAKKKKQALDNLFDTGRISQATHDSFNNDIIAAIVEIEKQQNNLLTKMQSKTQELENQIKTLETLLANYEIEHVVGEIDEELYQREIQVFSTGLQTAKNELETIKGAMNQLCTSMETLSPETPEIAEVTVPVQEAENVSITPTEAPVEEYSEEPVLTMEENIEQPTIETADTIETETPTLEETPQEILLEAHPQAAPQEASREAPQEMVIESMTEDQSTEEVTATTEAENIEDADNTEEY